MCDARLWRGGDGVLIDALRASGHPVIDVDLTGADRIEALAAQALASVEGPLIPIGFSMGGIVALAMALQAPYRMAGFALLDTNASADLPERAAQRPRQQDEVRKGALERIVTEELKPNYLAAANRRDGPLLRLLRDMALALGPDVFVRQSEALRTRPDLRPALDAVDAPVFLACGEEDALCPPEWHRAMAARVRRAELHVIRGAGHMLPLEQPHALAEAIAPWLKTVERTETCPTAS
jgi:pimeloyl-ACP methyl ester carboxylesterase